MVARYNQSDSSGVFTAQEMYLFIMRILGLDRLNIQPNSEHF